MSRKWYQIDFALQALEDFHSGSGVGNLGLFDLGQQSEEQNGRRIPVVLDNTVKGLLREACRQIVRSPHYSSYKEVWEYLFTGDGGDSMFVRALRPDLASLPPEPFRILNRTAIDSKTGTAKEGSLRGMEVGCAGVELKSQVRWRIEDNRADDAIKLLEKGLKNLRRIGGNRNRGLGAVKRTGLKVIPEKTFASLRSNYTGSPLALLVTLEAQEPIHITEGAQRGNILRGKDHIPGSVFLGAMRHEWRNEIADNINKPKERASAAALLQAGGKVSFGPFYPLPPGVNEALTLADLPKPVPLSWQHPQGESEVRQLHWEDESPRADVKLKRMESSYYCQGSIYQQPRQVIMRNQIDTTTGTVGNDGLFSVEAIPAGTRFAGYIYFEKADHLNLFMERFGHIFNTENDFWLGIGRGRKPVQVVAMATERRPEARNKVPAKFVVHLNTPLVSRDEALRFQTNPEQIFERILAKQKGSYKISKKLGRSERFRLFTPLGGLPDFPGTALAARSSYLFEKKDGASEKDLEKAWKALEGLAWKGIGEKRELGFGRFHIETGSVEGLAFVEAADQDQAEVVASSREELFEKAKELQFKDDPGVNQWQSLAQILESCSRDDREVALKRFIKRETSGGRKWASFQNDEVQRKRLLDFVIDEPLAAINTMLRYRALQKEGE